MSNLENKQFIESRLLAFKDVIELQTALVMHKANNRILPENIQNTLVLIPEAEHHRRRLHSKLQLVYLL